MKKYIITLSIAIIGTLLPAEYITAVPTYYCNNGECEVFVNQLPDKWILTILCPDSEGFYEGTGCYEGTICGGMTNPFFCEV